MAAFYPHFLEPSLAPGEELTPTELQILHLLCADKSNAEIAQIMDVKLPTVKTHVSHILDKAGREAPGGKPRPPQKFAAHFG